VSDIVLEHVPEQGIKHLPELCLDLLDVRDVVNGYECPLIFHYTMNIP